ncbi:lysophospholipid acyltransferase family protein [Actinomycetaceae bacterium MB13-C1-2]|nr:lysophospholipid acyltransferase family protein [Actinomycetaceae bacterium MB13-C1-2]
MRSIAPLRPYKGNLRAAYRALLPIMWPLVTALAKPRLQTFENLPKEGAFILAPNHMSNADPFLMGYLMADAGYEISFMAKDSLFRVPVLGWILRAWGMIPVVRNSAAAADSLVHARGVLGHDGIVGFYFEGTLTQDPAYWPMKGKTGLARLALDTRVPVIPVVQWGAQDIVNRYLELRPFGKRPELFIRVLPEIDYSDLPGDSSNHESVGELTQRLQDVLEKGSATLREELAPKTPWDRTTNEKRNPRKSRPFSKWRRELARSAKRQDVLPATPR